MLTGANKVKAWFGHPSSILLLNTDDDLLKPISSNVLAGFLLSSWDVEASAGSAVVVVVDGSLVSELAVNVDVDLEAEVEVLGME